MSGLLTPALAAVLIELVVAVGFDGVEPVGLSASRQADISGLSGEVVGAEEESVVDGAALGFVDGDGVAMADPPGPYVGGVEGPGAVDGVDSDASLPVVVDVGDGANGAVVHPETAVVAETDDLVADLEGPTHDDQRLSDQTAGIGHEGAGPSVEVFDVDVSSGEHQRRLAGLSMGPPVVDHPSSDRVRVPARHHPAVHFEQADRLVDVTGAQLGDRAAFGRVLLPAVLGERDGPVAGIDVAEDAAGGDLRQLLRVADQHDLRQGLLGPIQEVPTMAASSTTTTVEADS